MDFYVPNNSALVNILLRKKRGKLSLKKSTNLTNLEKTDPHINSKQERYIPANGKVDLEMVLESRLGLMVQNTLVSGEKIELMARVNLFM